MDANAVYDGQGGSVTALLLHIPGLILRGPLRMLLDRYFSKMDKTGLHKRVDSLTISTIAINFNLAIVRAVLGSAGPSHTRTFLALR